MDTEQARTFLTIVEKGSFVEAARTLHLTQSTVSARVRALEDHLGVQLFRRYKGGAELTPVGRRYQRYAETLVRTVQQARQDLGTPPSFKSLLVVGGRFGLWETLLLPWLDRAVTLFEDVAIRAEIGFETDLMQALTEGRIDIAVMYAPHHRPGLSIVEIAREDVSLFATGPDDGGAGTPGYVYVDWGPEFYEQHQAAFPQSPGTKLSANIGWLGLHHVLRNGGSGYFPDRLAKPFVAANRLRPNRRAPIFTLRAFAVHRSESRGEDIRAAIALMQQIARDSDSATAPAR